MPKRLCNFRLSQQAREQLTALAEDGSNQTLEVEKAIGIAFRLKFPQKPAVKTEKEPALRQENTGNTEFLEEKSSPDAQICEKHRALETELEELEEEMDELIGWVE